MVDFGYGDVGSVDHYNRQAVRLVRGGQTFSSFLSNADGTVTDQTTGLIWAKCAEGLSGNVCATGNYSYFTWAEALTAAENSTLAGYTDWRLPNVKELQSLVDYTKHNPSINSNFFPATPCTSFWTASPYTGYSSMLWSIYFYSGDLDRDLYYYPKAVRLVRGSLSFALTKLGTGVGTVTSNPSGINCGTDCSENYTSGTTITLSATPVASSIFASWGGACSGTTTCRVIMNAAKSATATFNIKTYQLTPSANPVTGGSFTPFGTQTVTHGARKTFTVTAASGYSKSTAVTGTCAQGSWSGGSTGANIWTTGAIAGNCTVIFNFTPLALTATTNAATNITRTSATLNGSVVSAAATATVSFDFGTNTNYGTNIAAIPGSVYSASAVAVSTNKSGLVCGTTYHFRIKAVSSAGTGYGLDKTFIIAACPIYTVTPSLNPVGGGTVSPNAVQMVTQGATARFTVTAASGYTKSTTVTGTCAQGSWSGASTGANVWTTGAITGNCTVIFNFTPLALTAVTNEATNTSSNSATLNGKVVSTAATATVSFDFGTSTNYGTNIGAYPSQVYSSSAVAVSTNISDLMCGTTYHFRIKAVSSVDTGYGLDKTFITIPCCGIPGYLYGQVRNTTGTLLAGARVTSSQNGQSVLTTANGNYVLSHEAGWFYFTARRTSTSTPVTKYAQGHGKVKNTQNIQQHS